MGWSTNPPTDTTGPPSNTYHPFLPISSCKQHITPQLHVRLNPNVCHRCPRTTRCQHNIHGIDSRLPPPPMGRYHDIEQPFLRNKRPSRVKYPPVLFTGTSPHPRAVTGIPIRHSSNANCSHYGNLPITRNHQQMAPPSSPAPPRIDQSP